VDSDWATWHYFSEDSTIHSHCSENLKSCIIFAHLLTSSLTCIITPFLTYLVFPINRPRVTYVKFSGSHDLILKVKGTGMIANMVRSLLGGFNIRQRVKNFYSNEGTFSLKRFAVISFICKSDIRLWLLGWILRPTLAVFCQNVMIHYSWTLSPDWQFIFSNWIYYVTSITNSL
jgi:hypothetical protein